MSLQKACQHILGQLVHLLENISTDEYRQPIELLSGNTVGKHIRHIIEFYQLLIESALTGRLNYDHRKHDIPLEQNSRRALESLQALANAMDEVNLTQPLWLEASLNRESAHSFTCQTNFQRELLYNIEHTIHHMAIIKIAVQQALPHVTLPPHFGVAPSTLRYQATQAGSSGKV